MFDVNDWVRVITHQSRFLGQEGRIVVRKDVEVYKKEGVVYGVVFEQDHKSNPYYFFAKQLEKVIR